MFLTDIYSHDGDKEEEADQTLQVLSSSQVCKYFKVVRYARIIKKSGMQVLQICTHYQVVSYAGIMNQSGTQVLSSCPLIHLKKDYDNGAGPGGDPRVHVGGERRAPRPHRCRHPWIRGRCRQHVSGMNLDHFGHCDLSGAAGLQSWPTSSSSLTPTWRGRPGCRGWRSATSSSSSSPSELSSFSP